MWEKTNVMVVNDEELMSVESSWRRIEEVEGTDSLAACLTKEWNSEQEIRNRIEQRGMRLIGNGEFCVAE